MAERGLYLWAVFRQKKFGEVQGEDLLKKGFPKVNGLIFPVVGY